MAAGSDKKINLTKVPLAFAEGGTLKKAARWNNQPILQAGTLITPAVIAEYEDVAMHIPVSLRIEGTIADTEKIVHENIRQYKDQQKADKVQDLSQTYAEGDLIFEQGDDEDQDCYFLTEGAVNVVIDGNVIATIDEPGQPIGEMSFLTGEPRSASIVAAGPAKLLRVRKDDQKRVMRENPTIVSTLLETLVRRLGDTSRKFLDSQGQAKAAQENSETLQLEQEKLQSAFRELEAKNRAGADQGNEVARIQANCDKLAKYAAKEGGIRKGNRKLFESILAALETRFADTLAGDGGAEVLACLRDYQAYLAQQKASAAVPPALQSSQLSDRLRRLLGG
ncbi:MAG: Crp/Fnr family transcriptional regulator [Planctomycetota bacterium]